MGDNKKFISLDVDERIKVIYKLVRDNPRKTGRDYSVMIKQLGFDIEGEQGEIKKAVNSILTHSEKFCRNALPTETPAWTINDNFENIITSSITLQQLEIEVIEKQLDNNELSLIKDKISPTELIIRKKINKKFDIYDVLKSWQLDAYKNWVKFDFNGYIVGARKTGKTYLAIRIAYKHCLLGGSAIICINNLREVWYWNDQIDELNNEYGSNIKILGRDSSNDNEPILNGILVGPRVSLNKIKKIHSNTLLIIEHIDHVNFDKSDFLDLNYSQILGFSNEVSNVAFNNINLKRKLKNLIYRYTITDAMLYEDVQKFKLNFIPCKISEIEEVVYKEVMAKIFERNKLNVNTAWFDIYQALENFKSEFDKGLIYLSEMNEIISIFQQLDEKSKYISKKIDVFKNYTKSIIYCEDLNVLRTIRNLLNKNLISNITYSNKESMSDISQSPNDWTSEKVFLCDHISNISAFELGEIDYAVIFGTLGNSARLTRKIESFLGAFTSTKTTVIDVLYGENSFEDPRFCDESYYAFKDYIGSITVEEKSKTIKKVEKTTNLKEVRKAVNITENINIENAKILILYSNSEKIEVSYFIDKLNIDSKFIEFQYIEQNHILEIAFNKAKSNLYSDILIPIKIEDSKLSDLIKLEEFKQKVRFINKSVLNYSDIILFLINSNKYVLKELLMVNN